MTGSSAIAGLIWGLLLLPAPIVCAERRLLRRQVVLPRADVLSRAAASYKTVQETVWEKQNIVCCKTVYDHVCEQVPYYPHAPRP